MIHRKTYTAARGVIYRVLSLNDGYGLYFRLPNSNDWICSVGMGAFSTPTEAEDALYRLADSMGWDCLGPVIPDPTKHWRDKHAKSN